MAKGRRAYGGPRARILVQTLLVLLKLPGACSGGRRRRGMRRKRRCRRCRRGGAPGTRGPAAFRAFRRGACQGQIGIDIIGCQLNRTSRFCRCKRQVDSASGAGKTQAQATVCICARGERWAGDGGTGFERRSRRSGRGGAATGGTVRGDGVGTREVAGGRGEIGRRGGGSGGGGDKGGGRGRV